MIQKDPLRAIYELGPGDHLCCIYETEKEHRAVLTPFLRQGLERGEKVFYIVDDRTAGVISDYLRDDGLDVEPYLDRGQLTFLTRGDAYVRGGSFDPDAMITLLESEMEQALAEGYSALRVTGEMSWALRGLPGSERLIEYETKLNRFLPQSRCLAICQYDRRRFDPEILLDVLRTHPIAVIGTQIYENFYYVPPDKLLEQSSTRAEFRRWVRNLAERKRAEEINRELTQRIEAGLRAGNLAWWEMELPSGKVIFDDRKAEMLGHPPERFKTYEDFTRLLHPDDHEPAMQAMRDHLDGKTENYEVEYRIRTRDGTYRWFRDVGGVTEQDETTGYTRVIGIVEDITERKRVEEALRERVKELTCLYAVSRDLQEAASIEEACGPIVEHLTSAMQFPEISVPVVELDGKRFTSEKYSSELSHSLRAGIKVEDEVRGEVRVYYTEKRPFLIPPEQDLLNGVAEALRMWLERKRAETALRESEERLRQVVENMPVMMDAVDEDYNIIAWNRECERVTGYSAEEMVGNPRALEKLYPDAGYRERMITESVQLGSDFRDKEWTLTCKDGTEKTISWSNISARFPIPGWHMWAIGMDITKRKQAEEALEEYSERLEEMVEERTRKLREAQERLLRREKLAVLGQFAGSINHDLRGPLGNINNVAYFLNMAIEEPDEDVQEALDTLQEEVVRAEGIVGSILDLLRTREPEQKEVDVNHVVEDVLTRVEIPQGVEVARGGGDSLPPIVADPDQLAQLLNNLIQNAIQAMPEGGRLTVQAEVDGPGWVMVSVADTGMGIPEEDQERIFEPLFTTRVQGTGLGLALVQTLVEGHGGTIEVESEVGEGSTFTVRLPVE